MATIWHLRFVRPVWIRKTCRIRPQQDEFWRWCARPGKISGVVGRVSVPLTRCSPRRSWWLASSVSTPKPRQACWLPEAVHYLLCQRRLRTPFLWAACSLDVAQARLVQGLTLVKSLQVDAYQCRPGPAIGFCISSHDDCQKSSIPLISVNTEK